MVDEEFISHLTLPAAPHDHPYPSCVQDADSGDSIAYTVVGGTGATVFVVDRVSGAVGLPRGMHLDREAIAELTLTVGLWGRVRNRCCYSILMM